MGLVPQNDEYCNACSQCFGEDATPEVVILFVGGVGVGDLWTPDYPPAPNQYFTLVLDTSYACSWKFVTGQDWEVHLTSSIAIQSLDITYGAEASFVAYTTDNPCGRMFTNQQPILEHFVYGSGFAFFMTVQEISEIVSSVTPVVGNDPRYEGFVDADGKAWLRFADKSNATHINIKLDLA